MGCGGAVITLQHGGAAGTQQQTAQNKSQYADFHDCTSVPLHVVFLVRPETLSQDFVGIAHNEEGVGINFLYRSLVIAFARKNESKIAIRIPTNKVCRMIENSIQFS